MPSFKRFEFSSTLFLAVLADVTPLIAIVALSCFSRRGSLGAGSWARGIGTSFFAFLALALSFALSFALLVLAFCPFLLERQGGPLLP